MGIVFSDLTKKLVSWSDAIPPSFAKEAVRDAVREIYDSHDWGFLLENSFIRTPAMISTGTANVHQFSNEVVLSADARALLDAFTPNSVPIEERQFRTLQRVQSGRNFTYSIEDYDTFTGIITIIPEYQDVSNSAAQFQILKMYYAPPWYVPRGTDGAIIDFKGWEFVLSPLYRQRLHLDNTQEELNRFDPDRSYVDEPRHLVPYSYVANDDGLDIPTFEFYPAPKMERVYKVQYRRRGSDPSKENEVIPFFTSDLIMTKAKIKAYERMLANTDKPAGKFLNLIAMLSNPNDAESFPNLLQKAKDRDTDSLNRSFMIDTLNDYCESSFERFIGETLVLSF